jgi:Membrane bound beta barrel domain (DUF5777)
MKKILFLFIFSTSFICTNAQDEGEANTGSEKIGDTFKSTRIINAHSVETLQKRILDIRIGHRFGNLGDGWSTFFGLEDVSDVQIGAEYGVTDQLMLGFNRCKGADVFRGLMNGFAKYRILTQTTDNKMPLSMTALAQVSIASTAGNNDPNSLANFSKFDYRMMYTYQLMVARKFSKKFSLQLNGTYVHRNLVYSNDQNGVFSLGLATRFAFNDEFAIILDAAYPFSSLRTFENGYYFPLGIGFEWTTGGGHVFQMNFTNSGGMTESDYLVNTKSNWLQGQFKLGFTISRHFYFRSKKEKKGEE